MVTSSTSVPQLQSAVLAATEQIASGGVRNVRLEQREAANPVTVCIATLVDHASLREVLDVPLANASIASSAEQSAAIASSNQSFNAVAMRRGECDAGLQGGGAVVESSGASVEKSDVVILATSSNANLFSSSRSAVHIDGHNFLRAVQLREELVVANVPNSQVGSSSSEQQVLLNCQTSDECVVSP